MKKLIFLLFFVFSSEIYSQNVGIGVVNPLEKLHINGDLRIDGIANTDTNIVLSDLDGKLINFPAGNSGQVLTSQGAGFAPKWATPSSGKVFTKSLTGASSVVCNTSSAGTLSLLSLDFIPDNDTVLLHFSAQGRLSSTVTLPAQSPTYVFRIVVNATTYHQMYFNLSHNGNGSTKFGFVPVSFSLPVPVNPSVNNTISVQVISFFTSSGTYTLTFDTSAFTQFAKMIVYDLPTN